MAKPLRILHVLGALNRGGIETWLLNVLRQLERTRFRFDFLVHSVLPGAYDEEVRALGGAILRCPLPASPWTYGRRFRRLLTEHGPYHAVHSHVHHYSGFVLRLARQVGVPLRIAHSHTTENETARGLLRRGYLALMRHWLARHATVCLSASRQAHTSLFGSLNGKAPPHRLLYCGIDLAPFLAAVDRAAVRAELGLPSDSFVLGHVGRFVACKNHALLLAVTAALPQAYLLLIGEGALQAELEAETERRGIRSRVVFAGPRNDVPRLLKGAVDLFLFPSHYEGLGLAAIEAQAAGLPCLLSDAIPEEAAVVPSLVRRVAPAQPLEVWLDAVRSCQSTPPAVSAAQAWTTVEKSPFNLCTGVAELARLYEMNATENCFE